MQTLPSGLYTLPKPGARGPAEQAACKGENSLRARKHLARPLLQARATIHVVKRNAAGGEELPQQPRLHLTDRLQRHLVRCARGRSPASSELVILVNRCGDRHELERVDGRAYLTSAFQTDNAVQNPCWRAKDWKQVSASEKGGAWIIGYLQPGGSVRALKFEERNQRWYLGGISKSRPAPR